MAVVVVAAISRKPPQPPKKMPRLFGGPMVWSIPELVARLLVARRLTDLRNG